MFHTIVWLCWSIDCTQKLNEKRTLCFMLKNFKNLSLIFSLFLSFPMQQPITCNKKRICTSKNCMQNNCKKRQLFKLGG